MSFIYKDGKYNTTRDSFVGRKIYKENAKLDQVKILDTWYQHPNYGLLNKNFEPVILNTDGSGANLNIFGQYSGDGPRPCLLWLKRSMILELITSALRLTRK